MEPNSQVLELINYMQRIFNQGELDPFIDLVQTPNRIVLLLASQGKVRPSEISDALRLSRPNITSNLKTLEDQGLVTRMINPDNRREVYVALTKEGQEKFEITISHFTEMFTEWFKLLGPEETLHVLKILKISSEAEYNGYSFQKKENN